MPYDSPDTFLELRAGPFRLALDAQSVVGVVSDVSVDVGVQLRGETLPYVDLIPVLVGGARAHAPFAVVFDSDDGRAAVGVDGVDHLRPGEDASVRPLPLFGLSRPELFTGALRVEAGLVLLLDPAALAHLTAQKERDI